MRRLLAWVNKFGNKYNGIIAILGLAIPFVSWIVTQAVKWTWVSDHKPCLFWSGVCVGLCIFIIAIFFRIRAIIRGQWWANRRREKIRLLSRKLVSISALQAYSRLNFKQLTLAKEVVPICIVDDRNATVIKREISDFGYKNITIRKDFPPDEELMRYAILILDIDGVGTKRDSNGLSFALKFKEVHPLKQLIMVSGYFSAPEYAVDVEKAKGKLDGFFTKGSSYDTCMRPLLERCLDQVVDPCKVWCVTRERLIWEALKNNGSSYAKLLEDEFVRIMVAICNENGMLPYDWIYRVLDGNGSMCLIDALRKYGLTWDEKVSESKDR